MPLVEGLETVVLALALSWALRLVAVQAFYIPSRSMVDTLRPFDHILAEKVSYRFRDPRRGEIVIFDFHGRSRASWMAGAGPALADNAAPDRASAAGAEGVAKEGSLFERVAGTRDEDGNDGPEFVKRVIGLPADEIDFRDGRLRVNGLHPREPYAGTLGEGGGAGAWAVRFPGRRLSFGDRGVRVDGRPLEEALPEGIPPEAIADRSPSNFVRLGGGMIGILRVHVPEGYLYVLGDNRAESADSRWFGFLPSDAVHGRVVVTYWPPSRARVLL